MVRKKITDLLGSELAGLQNSEQTESQSYLDNVSSTPAQQESNNINLQSPKLSESGSTEVAKQQSLERTDTDSGVLKQREKNPSALNTKNAELQSAKASTKQSLEQTESVNLEVPKYLQLERKEVRLRLDQLDTLTALIRRLNRTRKGKGERLTENTLIRVAIDLLLENADQLQGITEDELLESLGLPPSDER